MTPTIEEIKQNHALGSDNAEDYGNCMFCGYTVNKEMRCGTPGCFGNEFGRGPVERACKAMRLHRIITGEWPSDGEGE